MEDNLFEQTLAYFSQFAFFDLLGMGLALVFVCLGLFKGLRWQVTRLLGVLLALLVARMVAPMVSHWLTPIVFHESPNISLGISYVLLFLVALTLFHLIYGWTRPRLQNPKAQQLKNLAGIEDSKHRVLGGIFGIFTAAGVYTVIIVAVLLFASLGSMQKVIDSSYGASYTSWAISKMGVSFPDAVQTKAKKLITLQKNPSPR